MWPFWRWVHVRTKLSTADIEYKRWKGKLFSRSIAKAKRFAPLTHSSIVCYVWVNGTYTIYIYMARMYTVSVWLWLHRHMYSIYIHIRFHDILIGSFILLGFFLPQWSMLPFSLWPSFVCVAFLVCDILAETMINYYPSLLFCLLVCQYSVSSICLLSFRLCTEIGNSWQCLASFISESTMFLIIFIFHCFFSSRFLLIVHQNSE